MKKLFVIPDERGPYSEELACGIQCIGDEALTIPLDSIDIDYVHREQPDVVISTGLPVQWYYTFRGMNVVTLTLGERSRFSGLSDIVIDFRSSDPKHYFVGGEHSICENPDFDFAEVTELVKKLEWDSEFFGFNVAFLSCMHLTDNIFRRVEKFIADEQIRLVEYLCNCHDAGSVRVAEDRGFRFTDIRLKFIRPIREAEEGASLPPDIRFGLAEESHIPELRRIADGLYVDSRYHFDSNFEHQRVVEFYKNWVEKGVRGNFDDECWCLFEGGTPLAFCTIRYGAGGGGTIGLVGIDSSSQGSGLGKKLMMSVFQALSERQVSRLTVVTQGRNYGAQNLYQSVGFRTESTQLWYHKWI